MFYPKNVQIPTKLEIAKYVLLPITVAEVSYFEYADATGDIPDYDGYLILEGYIKQHQRGTALTFFLLDKTSDKPELVGGVHIRPGTHRLEPSGKYQAIVDFWVTRSKLADNLDKQILEALITWFKQAWAFDQVFFEPEMGYHRTRQMKLFTEAGLEHKFGYKHGSHPIYG
ncbi:MAG: hypothetical protein KC476_11250 [Cyanobacteria bacterium HKST-UBA06]|nr:hypothetical protein [Cyanobacteria bacterium HKST-UBA06]